MDLDQKPRGFGTFVDSIEGRVGWIELGRGITVFDTTCYTLGRRRLPGRERDKVDTADDDEQRNTSVSRAFTDK